MPLDDIVSNLDFEAEVKGAFFFLHKIPKKSSRLWINSRGVLVFFWMNHYFIYLFLWKSTNEMGKWQLKKAKVCIASKNNELCKEEKKPPTKESRSTFLKILEFSILPLSELKFLCYLLFSQLERCQKAPLNTWLKWRKMYSANKKKNKSPCWNMNVMNVFHSHSSLECEWKLCIINVPVLEMK